jgi:hypothetical protein
VQYGFRQQFIAGVSHIGFASSLTEGISLFAMLLALNSGKCFS